MKRDREEEDVEKGEGEWFNGVKKERIMGERRGGVDDQ